MDNRILFEIVVEDYRNIDGIVGGYIIIDNSEYL